MKLEVLGGTLDGRIISIAPEDIEGELTITYVTDSEIYLAKKFRGDWVLFFQGTKDKGKDKGKKNGRNK